MACTVFANTRGLAHQGSGGRSPVFPDVCLTPSGGGPVPIPYPNVALSSDTAQGSKQVTCDGNPICLADSTFAVSTGDEAGSAGGVVSGVIKGKAEFVLYSFDVKVEGKNVPRALDLMLHNQKNTPPFPLIQPPIIVVIP